MRSAEERKRCLPFIKPLAQSAHRANELFLRRSHRFGGRKFLQHDRQYLGVTDCVCEKINVDETAWGRRRGDQARDFIIVDGLTLLNWRLILSIRAVGTYRSATRSVRNVLFIAVDRPE